MRCHKNKQETTVRMTRVCDIAVPFHQKKNDTGDYQSEAKNVGLVSNREFKRFKRIHNPQFASNMHIISTRLIMEVHNLLTPLTNAVLIPHWITRSAMITITIYIKYMCVLKNDCSHALRLKLIRNPRNSCDEFCEATAADK